MEISVTIDAGTAVAGTGRVHWGTASTLLAGQSASGTRHPVPHPLGERLRYDSLTRAFVRAVGLAALAERTLIVKPS